LRKRKGRDHWEPCPGTAPGCLAGPTASIIRTRMGRICRACSDHACCKQPKGAPRFLTAHEMYRNPAAGRNAKAPKDAERAVRSFGFRRATRRGCGAHPRRGGGRAGATWAGSRHLASQSRTGLKRGHFVRGPSRGAFGFSWSRRCGSAMTRGYEGAGGGVRDLLRAHVDVVKEGKAGSGRAITVDGSAISLSGARLGGRAFAEKRSAGKTLGANVRILGGRAAHCMGAAADRGAGSWRGRPSPGALATDAGKTVAGPP